MGLSSASALASAPAVLLFSERKVLSTTEALSRFGNKGARLLEMTELGLPVPPGLMIAADAFEEHRLSAPTKEAIRQCIASIEKQMNRKFGSGPRPLFFSVRSSGTTSMPGMMDTILNVGFHDGVCAEMEDKTFALDSYARFLSSYSSVVLGLPALPRKATALQDIELLKAHILSHTGQPFSSDVYTCLWNTIEAISKSWMNPRAVEYRKLFPSSCGNGTAVVIQAMVFGNLDTSSATGVIFSRNPSTGEKGLFGEYLVQAQGDDVVSGVRTPQAFSDSSHPLFIQTVIPQLNTVAEKLETHYADMQDIEFTIETGKLWILQTRAAKRTAEATLAILKEHVDKKTCSAKEALDSIDPSILSQMLHGQLSPPDTELTFLAQGLPASPGPAIGHVCFSSESALWHARNGKDIILIRPETSPDDVMAMRSIKGLITAQGGMTSHAAVIARGIGLACITGVQSITLSLQQHTVFFGNTPVREGDIVTMDGSTGKIFLGRGQIVSVSPSSSFRDVLQWAKDNRRMRIYANAETVEDIKNAIRLGAEGVGLCRTEHMFFEKKRLLILQQIIMATSQEARDEGLQKLLPLQEEDFYKLLSVTSPLSLTVRLLDPPLHEFLPSSVDGTFQLAKALNLSSGIVQQRMEHMKEMNPMLGKRGCRLFTMIPGLYETQAVALAKAALALQSEGKKPSFSLMVPFVTWPQEFIAIHKQISKVLSSVVPAIGKVAIGAMLEVPSSAFYAKELAQHADFLSFGTNDMTQMALGLSRDDSHSLLEDYKQRGWLKQDPFQQIDTSIVGRMIEIAIGLAQAERPQIPISVCGEHAGDPASIHFFESLGITALSCSPYRVPLAQLAAAQAFKPACPS